MEDRILVVDDNADVREILFQKLKHEGYEVLAVGTAEEALSRVGAFDPAIIVTDIRMPGMGGISLIERVRASVEDVDFIVITGHEDMESTIQAMKAGAAEYLVKPVDLDHLEKVVEQCLRDQVRNREAEEERESGEKEERPVVVGSDPRMIEIYKMIGVLSRNRATVLVRGETGSGKEMIARAVHLHSAYSAEPFIAVNCTALTDSLLASELFGHVKGAFTGATSTRRGYFQLAGSGTIFLDEIGDTTPEFQSKLLRVLQERQFYPVGGETPISTEARVIAATHQPMEDLVEKGYFRRDLYFRLKVVEIDLPPLRERRDDIPLLADHLLAQIREKVGEDVWHITPEAMERLVEHDWPGNVRELENVLTRATILSRGGSIGVEHLSLEMEMPVPVPEPALPGADGETAKLDEVIATHVRRALEECGGDRKQAAELLGISRVRLTWLLRRMEAPV